jgi:hypothetical protein
MEELKVPYSTRFTRGEKKRLLKLEPLLRCDRLLLSLLLQIFGFLQFFHEPVYAAFRVHQLLPPGEKRMAVRADFHAEVAFMRRARFEGATASAGHIHFVVGGMNSGFHSNKNPFGMLPVYRGYLEIQTPASPELAMRGPVA